MIWKINRLWRWVCYQIIYLLTVSGIRAKVENDLIDYGDFSQEANIMGYKATNNKWGYWKIPSHRRHLYEQVVSEKGWAYNTDTRNYGVIGYPNVEVLLDSPVKIWRYQLLSIFYKVELFIEKHMKYNLCLDVWVNNNSGTDIKDTYCEIMVWEDYNVAFPAGKCIGEYETRDGQKYKVYYKWMNKSKENLGIPGWHFIAFVNTKRKNENGICLTDMLDHLIWGGFPFSDGLEDKIIKSVQLGTEVYNSSGVVSVDYVHQISY